MIMTNNFCRHLSNGIQFKLSTQLEARPCCTFSEAQVIRSSEQAQQARKVFSIIDGFQSARGSCNQCQTTEQIGFRESKRIKAFSRPFEEGTDDIFFAELQIDNNCNAACITCNETLSSQWATQLSKMNQHCQVNASYYEHPDLDMLINDILPTLNWQKNSNLQISGGETFYTDTQKKVAKMLVKHGHAKNISLRYTTNTSIFPDDETIDLWNHFKEIQIVCSVDGIQRQFEYIRWPLQWNSCERHIKKYRELANALRNLTIRFNHVINPFNAWYIDDFESWVADTFEIPVSDVYHHNNINLVQVDHAINTPVALTNTPVRLRDAIFDKYGNDHRVSLLVRKLPVTDHNHMLDWLSPLDAHRKIHWQDVFAEVADYFTN